MSLSKFSALNCGCGITFVTVNEAAHPFVSESGGNSNAPIDTEKFVAGNTTLEKEDKKT